MKRTLAALSLLAGFVVPAHAEITIDHNKVICDNAATIHRRLDNTYLTFSMEYSKQRARVSDDHPAAKLLDRMADITSKAIYNLEYYTANSQQQADAHACAVFRAVADQLETLSRQYNDAEGATK